MVDASMCSSSLPWQLVHVGCVETKGVYTALRMREGYIQLSRERRVMMGAMLSGPRTLNDLPGSLELSVSSLLFSCEYEYTVTKCFLIFAISVLY